jgi:hypothetical protein
MMELPEKFFYVVNDPEGIEIIHEIIEGANVLPTFEALDDAYDYASGGREAGVISDSFLVVRGTPSEFAGGRQFKAIRHRFALKDWPVEIPLKKDDDDPYSYA